MPRSEDEPHKERGKPPSPESRIVRALGEPDKQDPSLKKYPTDEDVARAVFADKLSLLSGKVLENQISIYTGQVDTARRKFITGILFPLHKGGSAVTARNDAAAIRGMYPGRNLSPNDIAVLVRRTPLIASSPSDNLKESDATNSPPSDGFKTPPYIMDDFLANIRQANTEAKQTPLGTPPPATSSLHYDQLPPKRER